jgi:hypothetical protein
MLTPPNCCIQVAPARLPCNSLFRYVIADIRPAQCGFRSCTFGGRRAQTATLTERE